MNIESSDRNKNKSKKLLKIVLNNPMITKVDVERKLYGSPQKISFDKLIDRTVEKIDEILLNFTRDVTSLYSERNYYYFYLKRKLLVIQMRFLRGVEFDIDTQFEKIISSANKFEHYDIMIEALHAKQRNYVLKNMRAVNQIQKLIVRYEEIGRKVQTTRNIWTRLSVQISRNASSINYMKELTVGRKLLREYFEQTASNTIGYYYYLVEMDYEQIKGNYKEAEIYIKKLLSLIINNESLYTPTKHGEVLINLANNKIFQQDFNSAIQNAIDGKNYFNSVNYYVATEVEFLARYYNGEINFAERLIAEMYNFCRSNGGPFLYSKYGYLFACIKTNRGEIEKSNELLLEVKEIEKDKGGWNLGKRILMIINGIESSDYEAVESKVLNLEKFLKRISKASYVRKRDKIILRILLKLINENFDFKKVYKLRKKHFDLLEGSDPEYGWKIKSPELIVFHEWFKGKMKEKSQQEISI